MLIIVKNSCILGLRLEWAGLTDRSLETVAFWAMGRWEKEVNRRTRIHSGARAHTHTHTHLQSVRTRVHVHTHSRLLRLCVCIRVIFCCPLPVASVFGSFSRPFRVGFRVIFPALAESVCCRRNAASKLLLVLVLVLILV